MDTKRVIAVIVVVALVGMAVFALGSGDNGRHDTDDSDTMTQVSVLNGLMMGDYYGSMEVGELLSHGDIGLGTFEGVDGEMIVLDGVCYQARYDGTVVKVSSDMKVPFACVTYLDDEFVFDIKDIKSAEGLKKALDEVVEKHSANYMYVAKIDGTFDKLTVRSELPQEEPYKKLTEVMKTDEVRFDHKDIEGTIVAVYCPNYMRDINSAGWHFHFISDDRKVGGHLLEVSFDSAKAVLDLTDTMNLVLPDGDYFKKIDVMEITQKDIGDVEQGS
ncbi:MAG: acetolactate decarboxylase [archaeon]|nr:acetolactate decarboxylase [archaeon]